MGCTFSRSTCSTQQPCWNALQVRNEKARRFLLNMRKKPGVSFEAHFPRADRGALNLLRRMLAFDPAGAAPTSCWSLTFA